MEKIIAINELSYFKKTKMAETTKFVYDTFYEGYEIVTNENNYKFLIRAEQQCCEESGYLTTNDDISEFIGAEIKNIEWTDGSLTTKQVYGSDCGSDLIACMFVNINTADNRKLQLVAYNDHNGFYVHNVEFLKNDNIVESVGI